MKRSLLFSICICYLINCSSQNRNNIWYFGYHAGINFNTNPPTAISNAPMYEQDEGVATICNNNGQILFYTNGIYVWNRNNTIMPNGSSLGGALSATQSALIIPKPCDS